MSGLVGLNNSVFNNPAKAASVINPIFAPSNPIPQSWALPANDPLANYYANYKSYNFGNPLANLNTNQVGVNPGLVLPNKVTTPITTPAQNQYNWSSKPIQLSIPKLGNVTVTSKPVAPVSTQPLRNKI